jgi:hypothetical protein
MLPIFFFLSCSLSSGSRPQEQLSHILCKQLRESSTLVSHFVFSSCNFTSNRDVMSVLPGVHFSMVQLSSSCAEICGPLCGTCGWQLNTLQCPAGRASRESGSFVQWTCMPTKWLQEGRHIAGLCTLTCHGVPSRWKLNLKANGQPRLLPFSYANSTLKVDGLIWRI